MRWTIEEHTVTVLSLWLSFSGEQFEEMVTKQIHAIEWKSEMKFIWFSSHRSFTSTRGKQETHTTQRMRTSNEFRNDELSYAHSRLMMQCNVFEMVRQRHIIDRCTRRQRSGMHQRFLTIFRSLSSSLWNHYKNVLSCSSSASLKLIECSCKSSSSSSSSGVQRRDEHSCYIPHEIDMKWHGRFTTFLDKLAVSVFLLPLQLYDGTHTHETLRCLNSSFHIFFGKELHRNKNNTILHMYDCP